MKTNPTNILLWLIVSLLGASAVGGIALHRGESINALWFITAALCIYAISYRFYAAWIAATVAHYLAGDGPKVFMPPVLLILLAASYLTRPASRQWPPGATVA